MKSIYEIFFTPDAVSNIEKCGNVWGYTQEYDFKFSIKILWRIVAFEQRSANSFLGRFGGGWGFKIGVQASSFKKFLRMDDVIFSLFTMTMRVKKQ